MIDHKNKVSTNLAAAIDDITDEVPIALGDYSAVLGGEGYVYLIIIGVGAKEIIRVRPNESSWGNFLKVDRGQGGTTPQDWPSGSKIYASTTAEGYNAMLQIADTRVIDYNPNEVLSPRYAGEKVYQSDPAGCERWWKAYDSVNPYWDIITGVPCGSEAYTDIGWLYDLLISTATCWVDKTSDAFWNVTSGVWNGSAWETDGTMWLTPKGGWEASYRPAILRISKEISGQAEILMRNTSFQNIISYESKIIEPSGTGFDLYWFSGVPDIYDLVFVPESAPVDMRITKLEFFECDVEHIYSLSSDASIQKTDAVWATARNASSGDTIVAANDFGVIRGDKDGANYNVFRLFYIFDLSSITITDVSSCRLRLFPSSISLTETLLVTVQKSLATAPLSVNDFNDFSGPQFVDIPLQFTGAANYMDFDFNSEGRAWIESELGNTITLCVREFTYDYSDAAPSGLNWMSLTMGEWFDDTQRPRLQIGGE